MTVKGWLQHGMLGLLTASGLAMVGGTAIAQTTEGFTIFGGIDSQYRLGYFIDNNERRSNDARYYLRVEGRKIPEEMLELQISYPDEFEEAGGYLTNAKIELREGTGLRGATIPVDEINVDAENNLIEIYPENPLPPNSSFSIVLFDVRNPNRYGNYYFTLDALYQGGPLREFVGIWPLEVAAE